MSWLWWLLSSVILVYIKNNQDIRRPRRRSRELEFSRVAFERLVREITEEVKPGLQFQSGTIRELQVVGFLFN